MRKHENLDVQSGIDVGEWPGPTSLKSYNGKSVYFGTARAARNSG